MISREDQTWTNVMNRGCAGETSLFEIATSLGRIADMLAEMNGYIVEYGEHPRAAEAHNAKPVRHGKWINCGTYDQGYQVTLECECCGEAVNGYVQDYKYCPYCGAKMEAYEEEEYEEGEE